MKIELTPEDIRDIGEYYWDYDYYPDYSELQKVADIINEKIAKKLAMNQPTKDV